MDDSPNMKCRKQIGISLPQRLTFAASRMPMSGPRDMRNTSDPELRQRIWQPNKCGVCKHLRNSGPGNTYSAIQYVKCVALLAR